MRFGRSQGPIPPLWALFTRSLCNYDLCLVLLEFGIRARCQVSIRYLSPLNQHYAFVHSFISLKLGFLLKIAGLFTLKFMVIIIVKSSNVVVDGTMEANMSTSNIGTFVVKD